MEINGVLKGGLLEDRADAGDTEAKKIGRITCGAKIASPYGGVQVSPLYIGRGDLISRSADINELTEVRQELLYSDSLLSDRIATIEAGAGRLVDVATIMMPVANESLTRISRNPTSLFIDASIDTGSQPSIVSSYITMGYLSSVFPIPIGVASSFLVSNISVHCNANPFLVGLNAAFNESWPAKGLAISIEDSSASIMLFGSAIKTVHSQHACTMSKMFGGTGVGSSGLAQIKVDTTSDGVKSFFVKSTADATWVSVPSSERISARVSWMKNMLWSGSPNFNPYSFISNTVGLFNVTAEVYKL